ncbi:helix-turn-helix domain-containing protein [Bordetella holmesii]|uniref:DNA-binding helix-turn-helix protein n=2 Tax=Bordetella holmesii TaxID=35814 RepID=A0A158M119_9BORD|nr:helix-turn-helix domain-containing protein [Bordetella holmesii]AHV93320.1 helix-turn-helix family protein [Bordetella holmesii ATCC 51541]EWM40522.1 helix-turn-helix family protein [Bordetella holmesii 35009]EWM49327.1 helix-turn-helix family protein [Bordetella holmesii 70147]AMD46521.1 XRE family transcriptional regulator [Bordetella holmesii H558]AMD48084.1 XRE family transcriptional regulator [Bordetella holmesii F627]
MNSHEEFGKRLGRALADHRRIRGLTQEQVAERLGVEQETISRFERGATLPPLNRLLDLTDVLGVPLDAVLAGGPARHSDQVSDIAARLALLAEDDREWVRRWVVELCQRLARHGTPTSAALTPFSEQRADVDNIAFFWFIAE